MPGGLYEGRLRRPRPRPGGPRIGSKKIENIVYCTTFSEGDQNERRFLRVLNELTISQFYAMGQLTKCDNYNSANFHVEVCNVKLVGLAATMRLTNAVLLYCNVLATVSIN